MEICKLVITDLKQGVKNPERVNMFISGKFAFSLDVAQVVDFKLKVGQELSEEEIAELRKASEFGKLYQRTLEWALMRPRSEREVRDYLLRRKIKRFSSDALAPVVVQGSSENPFDFSEEIINRLVAKGYVDDRKFAEFWVENRFVKKGVSRKRLGMELMKKGVAKEIIEEVLEARSDEEEIRKVIAKKRAKYNTQEKLMAYLARQGFSYDLVRQVMEEYQD